MSASTEKKNRRAAREAGTDKKMLAEQQQAKEKAKNKRRWTVGTIAVVIVIALVIFLSSGVLYSRTTAATVADEKYSPAEVSYYYCNQFWNFYSQYGDYASMFGLNVASGPIGLDAQKCSLMGEDATWRDYFMESALYQMAETKAVCDYAKANGIALSEEELAAIDAEIANLGTYAEMQGYSNVDSFLAANYGNGVTPKLVRKIMADNALASKTANQITESFEYSDSELEEYYSGLEGSSDMFGYAYYRVMAESTTVQGEDGESREEYTPEALAAAKTTAEAVLDAYKAESGENYEEMLNAAIVAAGEEGECVALSNTAGSNLGSLSQWLMAKRTAGDAAVVDNGSEDGFYVVVFISRDDNHYKTAQVRHILIKAEADETGAFTNEAKEAAKARAEEIYSQWKSGEKTEDSFAALAQEFSEDPGSSGNGGLYNDIAKNQMVEEFDKFCFEGHKPGDTAIIYGENGGYAGYHIVYYVGEGELYSNYIARNALVNADMEAWLAEQSEGYEAVEGFGAKFVG